MFGGLLDEFIPAEELREYLKGEPISDYDMADIIFYFLFSGMMLTSTNQFFLL